MLSMPQNTRSDSFVRMQLDRKYRNARVALLVVVAFTFINMVMRVSQSTSYWLFSANIPFFLTDIGMYFGGVYSYPTEEMLASGFGAYGTPFFYAMLAIAIPLVCAYFVCWLMSGSGHIGWMIGALALFGIDTLFVILWTVVELVQGTMDGLNADFVIDALLHAYVLYALIDGVIARRRYLALPADATVSTAASAAQDSAQ